ncbi:transcriptional regulator, AsnC family [Malonomonas rubra DSM 5091]|uniref:Transcriptional regulator, AsnC family n=1 Tax=Malonomonas rubra DSM 5091 TaxID=1122189 RepID=A0A1M6B6I2_MALRU|nr:Lrp/AsnC family transcriptional regulator [Malonomonas rubra]SHI44326.1 transcriptional regulator, AsnC family [Malonomonas rubra DSM 5091]
MKNERTIDEIDHSILEILQEKARVPNAEVARQVGMAPSAVLERIRKLEDRGFIEGYEVRLNPVEFDQGLAAFVHIRVLPHANGALAAKLTEVTGVQEVHQVAGEDGYLLKLRVADNVELGTILRDELMMLDGVESTRTSIVLNTIKETRKIDLNR